MKRNQVVKINGWPVGIAIPTAHTKIDEGVEYTLCAFNNNNFSMWIPTVALQESTEYQGC